MSRAVGSAHFKIFIMLLWLKIIRPQTLFASICPVLVGLMASPCNINTSVAIVTIVCALSLQILSNLINDYYDFRRGTDKKGRAGFSRALAEGWVTEKQMRDACLIALAISFLTGAYLVIAGGIPILIIGIFAIFFAWLYTATNHSLSYLGIADIFVFLFYGIIASGGTTHLQLSSANCQLSIVNYQLSITAGAVCGLISMCVLIINNLRDIDSDREAGKHTFPVRFGKRAGEIGMLCVILLMPLFAYFSTSSHSIIPCLIIIPALFLFFKTLLANGSQYNVCLLMAGITNAIFVLLYAIAI